ncbi:dihydrodipicolinate reductase [Rhodococcus sp. NPDC003318]|uniref:NAD(P)H-dependent amine dehydrogenase family protein n=1 Tax=Rhodococcus sp. NPDC003318 TaxID=3364503 RepID=UPI0036AAEC65
MISTIVWGCGGIARDAIRAVDAHPALELTAVLVTDPDRVGRDAGDLAELDRALGVVATDDSAVVFADRPRAVVYAGSGRTRSVDARADVLAALRAGAVVVTPPVHPLRDHHDPRSEFAAAVAEGGGSLFVGDVDPGWANHVLPLLLRGHGAGATSIRYREIVDYSEYDLPRSVRALMGMGEPLSYRAPMFAPRMPTTVWGDRLRLLARVLGVDVDEIRETVERLELEVSVETATMGKFESGGQGAVRFEVQGYVAGEPRVVIEHIGRIDPDCAPDWPTVSAGGAAHQVVVEGDPWVETTIESGPRDGTAAAVGRLVGAIEVLAGRPPGVYDAWALRDCESFWSPGGPEGLTGVEPPPERVPVRYRPKA